MYFKKLLALMLVPVLTLTGSASLTAFAVRDSLGQNRILKKHLF